MWPNITVWLYVVISGQQKAPRKYSRRKPFSLNPFGFSPPGRNALYLWPHGTVSAIGKRRLSVRLLIQDEVAREGIEDDEFS